MFFFFLIVSESSFWHQITIRSAWDRQSLIQNLSRSSYKQVKDDSIHIQFVLVIHQLYLYENSEYANRRHSHISWSIICYRRERSDSPVKIMTKTREQLTFINFLKFNDKRIERIDSNEVIYFRQDTHIQDIQLINLIEFTIITNAREKIRMILILRNQYIAQRARKTYLISICQSEASFDLFRAAQLIEIISDDIISLNKRLNWQIINQSRDLKHVRLNLTSLRLMIFTDSSFVNSRDLSSQIDYVICLTDFINTTNIIHWFSIKCKRMTRSVLAVELFVMIHDFDVDSILKSILIKMLVIDIFLILIIDSKFLYDCLIWLNIIVEKRLMIDVMTLRQFYERREITEIIWIHDINNSVDSMIKIKSSTALKTMININKINLILLNESSERERRSNQNKKTESDEMIESDEKVQKDESKECVFIF